MYITYIIELGLWLEICLLKALCHEHFYHVLLFFRLLEMELLDQSI